MYNSNVIWLFPSFLQADPHLTDQQTHKLHGQRPNGASVRYSQSFRNFNLFVCWPEKFSWWMSIYFDRYLNTTCISFITCVQHMAVVQCWLFPHGLASFGSWLHLSLVRALFQHVLHKEFSLSHLRIDLQPYCLETKNNKKTYLWTFSQLHTRINLSHFTFTTKKRYRHFNF